uniref:RNA-directed RNA polymerase n=1 Tax=Schistocephalus solidus TaxID=70667 RepID=A0A183TKC8_SCHSO
LPQARVHPWTVVRCLPKKSTGAGCRDGAIALKITQFASLGGDRASNFANRVFTALFADEMTYRLTFYGRHQEKKTFFISPLYGLLLGNQILIIN